MGVHEVEVEKKLETLCPSDATLCALLGVLPSAVWEEYPAYGWAISGRALMQLIMYGFFKNKDEQLREAIEGARAAGYLE